MWLSGSERSTELRHLDPQRRRELEHIDAAYINELIDLLNKGAAQAQWKVHQVCLTANSLLAMLDGALTYRFETDQTMNVNTFVQQMVLMIRQMLQVRLL